MKKILGISAFYHDSAASLCVDGEIIAAAQEERFTRIKNTADFPVNAIQYCLKEANLQIDDLDAIVFYDKPILKFERLLETYYAFAPRGLQSFLKSMPVWLNEKIFLKQNLYKQLASAGSFDKKKLNLLFTEHHLAHAASAYYASPFNKSTILTIDGVGEWCTASISLGEGHDISILRELSYPHSVGLLYSAFTYYLGFKVNSGEYKLMGLAPYGNAQEPATIHYEELIRKHLVDIKDDGSIWLNQDYFTYSTGLKMLDEKKWEMLFGLALRKPESSIEQAHCNLAFAIQKITEDIVYRMAVEAKRLTGCEYLCMAGGVALNCVANGKLLSSGLFKDIYIQPAAGDAGGAIGAALAANYLFFRDDAVAQTSNDKMKGAYLGPGFNDQDIEILSKKYHAVYQRFEDIESLTKSTAEKLNSGHITGWFQDRMEFGPRALGNRSIIAYAGYADMQENINTKIKFREGFRPFAPAVLAEDKSLYFELETDSPYMLFVAKIRDKFRKEVPANYKSLNLWDQLKTGRSEFQSVTHVDFSARVQTVHTETNPKFHKLIQEVKQLTGHGILINTSFNVRGEPVVCTPEDAYRCFMQTGMDDLVINNYVFTKKDQPPLAEVILNSKKSIQLPDARTARKTVFTIAAGFILLFIIYRQHWQWITALSLVITALCSSLLSKWIHIVWMKLAYILSLFMPKIILSFIFYFVLFPIAIISRLFSRKDPLMLKNKKASTFSQRDKYFTPEDFKKTW